MTTSKETLGTSDVRRPISPAMEPSDALPQGLMLHYIYHQLEGLEQRAASTEQAWKELQARMERIETVEYVHPKLEPTPADAKPLPEILAEVNRKLDQLGCALESDDEVEADAIRLSARKDIKAARRDALVKGPLRFGLGALFDVLTFTPISEMSTSGVDVLRRYAEALRSEPLDEAMVDDMRRDLDRAGFQLRPLLPG